MSHMMHFDGSRPPPTPREMYAEGMYASIEEQGHYDHKKQAPPPPKRDPNTRLSSSSQMAGMNNYQEIEVHETSHTQFHGSHHQHHHQQQQSHHHQQQQSHHHQQQYYQQQQYSDHHSQQQQQQLKYGMQQQQQQHHSSQQHQYSSQQQHSMQMQHMQQHHQQYYSQQKQQTQQHPIQQQHMKYDQQQQSPRHTAHVSPTSRSKFSHEPQSPSHSGDKPFSYGITMSPKLNRLLSSEMKHTSQNGNGHTQQTAPMSPTRGDYQREESPVMSYGKHESTFPSQAHRPPPHGPPPPVPQQGSPSPKYPSSPVLPRHSVTSIPNNSRIQEPPRPPNPKLSQRSMSVPCNNNGVQQSIVKPQPVMSAGFGYNGMGHPAHRTPSPPLPPPPPELMDEYSYQTTPHQQQYHHNQPLQPTQMLSQMPHGAGNQALPNTHSQSPPRSSQPTGSRSSQAPPPPPLNLIPRKQTNAPTNISSQNVKACTERSMKGNYPLDVNGNAPMEQPHRGKSHSPSGSPMRGSIDSNADQTGLLQQISKVQLKKTGGRQSSEEGSVHEEVQQIPPQASPQSLPVSKDSSPTQETEVIPVNSAVDMFEKKVESVIKEESRLRRKGDTSKNSGMDFNIDDIDLGDVPGYTPITKSTPIWKRDMIEKKNQEKIEEYIAKKRKEKEDAEKWKHVPAWKRKLMMEKEKEKEKKSEAELKQPATSPTPPKTTPSTPAQPKIAPATPTQPKKAMKEEEELRKAKLKEQKEMEKQMDEELQDVPAWKKEIMMKRGGAIKNWADERETINEQELDGENRIENSDEMYDIESLPPPPPSPPPDHHHPHHYVEPEPQTSNAEEPTPTPTQPPPSQQTQQTQQSKASVVLKPQLPKDPPEAKKTPKPAYIDESKLEDEWDSLPLWKREIMMKRGGAPTNWGDEREDKNEEGVEQ